MNLHEVDKKNNSMLLVRLINIARIPMYFSVAWMQFLWYLECIRGPTPGLCNAWNYLVPMYLGILDVLMALWSAKPKRGFWSAAVLVSLLAIGISVNSILPIIRGTSSNIPMLIMGTLVLTVSLIEFIGLLKGRTKDRKLPEWVGYAKVEGEFRTY